MADTRSIALFAAVLLLGAGRPPAAAGEGAVDPTAASGLLRVFIDCPPCDRANIDYLRAHVTFVDHVREPAAAQVHVLLTSQSTAAGGDEITMTFIGRGAFAGLDDTLRFATRASDTDEAEQRAAAQTMSLGLMRYAARTPAASGLTIGFDAGGAAAAAPPVTDRWHDWVFSTHLSGNVNGQSSAGSFALSVSQSVNRVRAESKFGLTVSGNYRENRYTLSAGERLVSISRYREASGRYVWSLGEHWSTMVRSIAYSSTYENVRFQMGAGGGLEYNVFPYSQSTRRQLRIEYTAGARRARYFVPTVYGRTRETLYREGIEVLLDSAEPWGSSELRIEAQHFFHDLHRNNLEASGSISLRVTEGLSLELEAFGERVRDQLSLPAESASDEEILLQRRQLATEYQYGLSIGVSFTFGSIYNNVVNPRFGTDS